MDCHIRYSPPWPGVHTDDTDGDDGLRYSPPWPGVHTDDTDGDDGTTESGLHCTLVPQIVRQLH